MSVEVSACTPIVWKLTLVLPCLKVTVAQVCISRFNNVFTDVVHCARLLFIPSLLFRIVLGVVQSPRLGCTCVTYTNSVSIIAWYNWDLYRCCFMYIWNLLTQYISLKSSHIWWQFVLISSRIFYPFDFLIISVSCLYIYLSAYSVDSNVTLMVDSSHFTSLVLWNCYIRCSLTLYIYNVNFLV